VTRLKTFALSLKPSALVKALLAAALLMLPPQAAAQESAAGQPPPMDPRDVADRRPNVMEPDFTVVNLPTTLRLPRFKSAFRIRIGSRVR
jgi:hypothetical protein